MHDRFNNRPYDFVSAEVQAQAIVAEELKKHIIDDMIITEQEAFPQLIDTPCSRVCMEWQYNKNTPINDITIFKGKKYDPLPKPYDDVEAAIEIKIGWGAVKDHLEHPTIIKDFSFVQKHPNIGFVIIFLANNINELIQGPCDALYYERKFKEQCKSFTVLPGHAFLVFRDKILIS